MAYYRCEFCQRERKLTRQAERPKCDCGRLMDVLPDENDLKDYQRPAMKKIESVDVITLASK